MNPPLTLQNVTLQKTVRSFWEGVNWENRGSFSEIGSAGQAATSQILSLKLSVNDYFRIIPWSGIPTPASPTTQPSLAKADERKETFEDFLDDISSFF
jgi:hypothetical protein